MYPVFVIVSVADGPIVVTVSETSYVPGLLYTCVGFWSLDVPLSPNAHAQEEIIPDPTDRSMNFDVSGATPYRY